MPNDYLGGVGKEVRLVCNSSEIDARAILVSIQL
jgi:hypothetical protein